MGFSHNHISLIVSPLGGSLNIRQSPTTLSAVLFKRLNNPSSPGKIASAGRSTGDTFKDKSGFIWYKISLVNKYKGQRWGWVRNDVIKFYKSKGDKVSQEKAQSLVNNLIATDQKVYTKALLLAPLLDIAEKKGNNIESLKIKYLGIIKRLERRQNKIKTSKLLKWRTGIEKGLTWFKNAFKSYLSSPTTYKYGINGIGSITAIVVSGVIGGGLVVAAYFAFRPDYDESTIDLEMSKELEKALSLLTPEEAQKLQANLEKQVDNAYNTGKSNERFNIIAKYGLYALLVAGSFWGGSKLLKATKSIKNT